MFDFLPAILVFLFEIYLVFAWLNSHRKNDGREKRLCFWGFLLGQLYLLWEVILIGRTGKPLPGSPAQRLLMGRLLLGGAMGGFFTIVGLFYLSFGSFSPRK
ncbi:MAG: hypothetical protein KF753_18165 [Caldilineaceae bacterium]|nr:hypothetical protein [Caldilineaceae bacterium]